MCNCPVGWIEDNGAPRGDLKPVTCAVYVSTLEALLADHTSIEYVESIRQKAGIIKKGSEG